MAFTSSLARMVLFMALVGIAFGVKDLKEQQVYVFRKPCKMDFSSVDFSAVTKVCKAPDYNEKECCEAFNQVACKYVKHVNDHSTSCPVEFVSYLHLAGMYPMGVFVGRCTKPGDYRLCSQSD
ncbi:hypothetical protein SUGI_0654220 [Cryptomeria japonica]|uniref:GPI-anchored protein LORELEI n=1 Tax=Cryptomeria japonica TaxID=3369 RepID=UPI002414892F|nr:GPI-anchored protein LORELEI [Cryptomeria japonica]GLJ32513.1 hypothetical protein SUGI_0654220 [Cryptomeria japonica]